MRLLIRSEEVLITCMHLFLKFVCVCVLFYIRLLGCNVAHFFFSTNTVFCFSSTELLPFDVAALKKNMYQ